MIVLVQMPYAGVEHPSLALGILQAELTRQGLESRVLYPNLQWCEELGVGPYHAISATQTEFLIGEWTFSRAVFGPFGSDEEFLGRACQRIGRDVVLAAREAAEGFVDRVAREILAMGARVVGASSTFQQHCASLALLRRVKTLEPSVATVLGGANCEGPMGLAAARNFPWVDYVVSGEADQVAVRLFRSVLEGKPELPYGVITRAHQGEAPRATFAAMDATAIPDYDDYFRAVEASSLDMLPGLLVETSRGCWWGQKHHCTFCGLNGSGMGYRSKSGERVLQELEHLANRYQLGMFEVVDNILDHAHLKHIMPVLAARPEPFRLFYETKSNLRREQVEVLAKAGVLWIQPGIESLHDEILKLMDKGSNALMNVQLLKWAREFGVRVVWNFLTCFPGERDAWYQEMADFLPLLEHLQPPSGMAPIRYDRFSPYHSRPADYGISIQTAWAYACVYPLPPEELAELAYFFEDVDGDREDRRLDLPGRQALAQGLKTWKEAFWASLPPILSSEDTEAGLQVLDTRRCAVQRRHVLTGAERELLLACDTPRKLTPELAGLVEKKLVLAVGDRCVALPVRGSLPRLPAHWQFPGGFPERPSAHPPYRVPSEILTGEVHA